MNIREFAKPVTAKSLNESLASKFGNKIDLNKFTLEQLEDARNKLRTKMFNVETTESFNSVQNETYTKSKMMMDVLTAEISERGGFDELDEGIVVEGAEDQAELVMAAKDMVDRITSWMEDTAEMQTESMLEMADAIRDEMGVEAAESFSGLLKPSLETLYSTLESTRQTLIQGVGQLTGEGEPVEPMGDDDMDMEPTVDDTADMDFDTDEDEDDFGADAASAGADQSAGREKRESVDRSKKK